MELEFRSARADDRGPIAELIYSSGPQVYDYLHGKRALEFLRHEFASGRGFAGYPHVSVALLAGEVVATGCFYDRKVYKQRSQESAKNMFTFYGPFRGLTALGRARHMGSVMRTPKPGELYLSNFGVAPHLRSQGIGSRFLDTALADAKRQGYTLFGLDVSAANPRGQVLYERLGLKVTKEKVFSNPRAMVPNGRKMELSLD
jgi:ribosomal protein S18 acetylase RimI-like enzyme